MLLWSVLLLASVSLLIMLYCFTSHSLLQNISWLAVLFFTFNCQKLCKFETFYQLLTFKCQLLIVWLNFGLVILPGSFIDGYLNLEIILITSILLLWLKVIFFGPVYQSFILLCCIPFFLRGSSSLFILFELICGFEVVILGLGFRVSDYGFECWIRQALKFLGLVSRLDSVQIIIWSLSNFYE